MTRFEYKVVPAPTRGQRAKGVKGQDARFANTLSTLMNDMGEDGWEYLRADTLPCEERQGITGRSVVYKTLLVFRRQVGSLQKDGPAPGAQMAAAAAPLAAAESGGAQPSPKLPGFSRGTAQEADDDMVEPEPETASDADREDPPLTSANSEGEEGNSSKLLTDRGHSFATYSPHSRLPGVRTRD